MKVNVKVMNAFSINGQGGNPAGVVLDADIFSREQKQAIATAANFPETAFVSASKVADFKLDFFTPNKQIAHCGHATIATFGYLRKEGKIIGESSSKETIDGNRAIRFIDGQAFMEQREPRFTRLGEYEQEAIKSLGITHDELSEGLFPEIGNTGNSFLLVKVKNEAILESIQYNREAVYQLSERFGLIGYYVYTDASSNPSLDATTRMFGPYYGIEEEAGTGMAAGPLAAFLYEREGKKKRRFRIEQGRFMASPSPSLIQVHLELEGDGISRLYAGGDFYISGEKWVDSDLGS